MDKEINLATDFSKAPVGRYSNDSNFSGERFRDEFLIPALEKNDKVTILLDGLDGIGSSFWDEAFGGLVRSNKFSEDDLKIKLELKCSDDDYLVEHINSFIDDAINERHYATN